MMWINAVRGYTGTIEEMQIIPEKISEKVVIWYQTTKVELNRAELFEFLSEKTLKNFPDKLFYNNVLKAFYTDAYDFIIKHFDEIDTIQIYQDNAIHLYLGDRHYTEMIVFEDYDFCNNEMTSEMVKELIAFCNQ